VDRGFKTPKTHKKPLLPTFPHLNTINCHTAKSSNLAAICGQQGANNEENTIKTTKRRKPEKGNPKENRHTEEQT